MSDFEQTILGLVRFATLVIGLTYYLTGSMIFASLRVAITRVLPWKWVLYFVYCPMCVGTWITGALVVAELWVYPIASFMDFLYAITAGCVANIFAPHAMPADHPAYGDLNDTQEES